MIQGLLYFLHSHGFSFGTFAILGHSVSYIKVLLDQHQIELKVKGNLIIILTSPGGPQFDPVS